MLTPDETARKTYLTGAADQLMKGISDGDADAVMETIKKMRHDGYRREANTLLQALAELALVTELADIVDSLRVVQVIVIHGEPDED